MDRIDLVVSENGRYIIRAIPEQFHKSGKRFYALDRLARLPEGHPIQMTFATLEEARRWITQQLAS